MNAPDQITLFIVSLVANLFSAFSGGGAGLIQLPVLIFLGLPFTIALATHKVASVALGIGATVRHLREQPLERRLALYILAFGLPGVIVGANIILDVPERTAEVALGILTVGLGVYSWLNPRRHTGTITAISLVAIWVHIWPSSPVIAGSSVPLRW